MFTLVVSNMEEQEQHLSKLNIKGVEKSASARVKTLMITDPDGNHIAFAEPLDPALAQ